MDAAPQSETSVEAATPAWVKPRLETVLLSEAMSGTPGGPNANNDSVAAYT